MVLDIERSPTARPIHQGSHSNGGGTHIPDKPDQLFDRTTRRDHILDYKDPISRAHLKGASELQPFLLPFRENGSNPKLPGCFVPNENSTQGWGSNACYLIADEPLGERLAKTSRKGWKLKDCCAL
jgi:hypothetical protein